MPPRRAKTTPAGPAHVTRQPRIAKTMARRVILDATNASNLGGTGNPPEVETDRLGNDPDALTGILQAGFANLQASFETMHTSFQTGLNNLGLEIHRSSAESFSQITDYLDDSTRPTHLVPGPTGSQTTAPTLSTFDQLPTPPNPPVPLPGTSFPLPSPSANNVLSRWPWVEASMVASIANGEFDINNLVKLHREEEVRQRHTKMTTEGVFQPLDKSKSSEVIVSMSKLHRVFKDLPTFLGAWTVYTSIRVTYSPDRGAGILLFTERIVFHYQLNYPWSNIFNYILAFFRKHQNSHPDIWNDVDSVLVSNYLSVSQQRPPPGAAPGRTLNTRSSKSFELAPISQQVCHNWNRMHTSCNRTDCPRRHVCAICQKEHRSWQCPSAVSPSH